MNTDLKICNETEYLQIAGIQHFVFCRRQWGLIHLEQRWEENFFTADGRIKHDRVDHGPTSEKIGSKRVLRSMHVVSHKLQIQGKCDAVELVEDPDGSYFSKYHTKYNVYPIEYKRGKEKDNDSDTLQLVAQAICLEEMMGVHISTGFIYYFETRRRKEIAISDELRDKVKEILAEMNKYYKQAYVPRVKKTRKCRACSLQNICMPELGNVKSAKAYIQEVTEE
ncbi:MAG: CRISPR-associated protein Cas4 [Acidaminococcus sp.]|jgi:CRISPR-associated exonuclease Cas4|nr:CRISPR-associated protein Cas4 [Acidaminococcus sp.]MCI2100917.1 CRISPR-associated protein Cas4 [Acidaminococcus sp.]MCI2115249.1 CRISPR-associated protein Cas4 [Acidaminococcus sp.]